MMPCVRLKGGAKGVGAGMSDDATQKPRRFFTFWRLVLFWLAALALYFLTPLARYVSWLTLDVPSLNGHIDKHMREVHRDVPFACLYTVTCKSGGAAMEIQVELTPEELITAKREIWRRRFEDYCPGRTANIGLEHGGDKYPAQDKWAFGHGFGGATGFGQGGSFSAEPWTPCTRELAYWTREDGIIAGKPRP